VVGQGWVWVGCGGCCPVESVGMRVVQVNVADDEYVDAHVMGVCWYWCGCVFPCVFVCVVVWCV